MKYINYKIGLLYPVAVIVAVGKLSEPRIINCE